MFHYKPVWLNPHQEPEISMESPPKYDQIQTERLAPVAPNDTPL